MKPLSRLAVFVFLVALAGIGGALAKVIRSVP
jgi:hypothetical protein